jgi:hypothetical protein
MPASEPTPSRWTGATFVTIAKSGRMTAAETPSSPRFDAQEHQRHTDEVVEIGFRDESIGAKERGEQFLRGGLADATGHADDASLELRAPAGGDTAERDERVVDDELRKVVGDGASDQGASGALRAGGFKEVMSVTTFGAHGHEDVAGAERAGIRTETRDRAARGDGPAAFSPGGEVG